MKELSIFIDESGDFGEYDYHSPWYIVTMVFHEQDVSIQEPMEYLNRELSLLGLENHCIHTGPIIRKEEEYSEYSWPQYGRRRRYLTVPPERRGRQFVPHQSVLQYRLR